MKSNTLPFWPDEQEAFTPPEDITVSECADKYRILSYKSEKRGPWETSYNPVSRGFMDAFAVDGIHKIFVIKPTQSSGTESLLNMILYTAIQDPGDWLIVEPNEDKAEEISTDRIDDMIHNCDKLKEIKDMNRDSTIKKKAFKSMTVYFGWAGSPASLASRAVPFIGFDEVNKYPAFSGKEASPLDLGEERTNTFKKRRKIVYVSTPTDKNGYISVHEKNCHARFRYLMACPHCGHKQQFKALDHDGEKYTLSPQICYGDETDINKIGQIAWYECEQCSGKIHEDQRMELVRRGGWYDLVSGFELDECYRKIKPRSVSFQYNRLCTPWFTFGEVAAEFLCSVEIPEKLMNFVNSWMAEPFEEFVPVNVSGDMLRIMDERKEGEVPEGTIFLVAGADVHKSFVQHEIRAFSRTESWLIVEGRLNSLEDLAAVWFGKTYTQVNTGKVFRVVFGCIDMGYKTDEVYNFAKQHPRAFPIKGDVNLKSPCIPSKIEYYPNGKRMPKGLTLWRVDTHYFKDWLARRINGEDDSPVTWHIHSETSKRYMDQINSEHKVTTRNRNTKKVKETWELKPGHRRNEALDIAVYSAAAAHIVFSAMKKPEPVVGNNKPVTQQGRRVRNEGIRG
jgi:phage terminase large subunit GpA-like protein